MSFINSCSGKSGAEKMILQAAKTEFYKIGRQFRWRGAEFDG
jgi:hypothetical protein